MLLNKKKNCIDSSTATLKFLLYLLDIHKTQILQVADWYIKVECKNTHLFKKVYISFKKIVQ